MKNFIKSIFGKREKSLQENTEFSKLPNDTQKYLIESRKLAEKNKQSYELNEKGIEAERNGEVELAIKFYEENIKCRFEGSHPYNRLAIIYRKQKRYFDEKGVLEIAIEVFNNDAYRSRQDLPTKLEKFQERLDKVNQLIKKQLEEDEKKGV
ncbi:MAG: hypothetical protein U5K00_07500 [Melioribacteraceae bacterium]|nr:hypothetical protein [Melioribacteraceae bacterium]